jgi:hypothetical protein
VNETVDLEIRFDQDLALVTEQELDLIESVMPELVLMMLDAESMRDN